MPHSGHLFNSRHTSVVILGRFETIVAINCFGKFEKEAALRELFKDASDELVSLILEFLKVKRVSTPAELMQNINLLRLNYCRHVDADNSRTLFVEYLRKIVDGVVIEKTLHGSA